MKQEKAVRVERLGVLPLPNGRGVPIVARELDSLQIGEAVAVSGGSRNSLTSAIAQYGKRYGKKFATRKLDDGRIGIWRVS